MGRARRWASTSMAGIVDGRFERELGQGMAEYAVVMAGVALMVIVSLAVLGGRIGALIDNTGKLIG